MKSNVLPAILSVVCLTEAAAIGGLIYYGSVRESELLKSKDAVSAEVARLKKANDDVGAVHAVHLATEKRDYAKQLNEANRQIDDLQKKLADQKVQAAIAAAKPMNAEPVKKNDNDQIVKFHDNPEKFKDKTLTFEVVLDFDISKDGKFNRFESIQKFAFFKSQLIRLKHYDEKTNANIEFIWKIDSSEEYPAARHGDSVVVTFKCTKGDRKDGNEIIKIERP